MQDLKATAPLRSGNSTGKSEALSSKIEFSATMHDCDADDVIDKANKVLEKTVGVKLGDRRPPNRKQKRRTDKAKRREAGKAKTGRKVRS